MSVSARINEMHCETGLKVNLRSVEVTRGIFSFWCLTFGAPGDGVDVYLSRTQLLDLLAWMRNDLPDDWDSPGDFETVIGASQRTPCQEPVESKEPMPF